MVTDSLTNWKMGLVQRICCCCSVVKLCLTLCEPMGLQHARLPCPSLSPRVCSNSCPLNPWCRLTISSSVAPFSSCPQSFPASGSFPLSQLLTSGGQSIRASASMRTHETIHLCCFKPFICGSLLQWSSKTDTACRKVETKMWSNKLKCS